MIPPNGDIETKHCDDIAKCALVSSATCWCLTQQRSTTFNKGNTQHRTFYTSPLYDSHFRP